MRIFGLKRLEVTGGCRNLCNKEVQNIYHSPILVCKSRRMRWTWYMEDDRYKNRYLERVYIQDKVKDLTLDGRTLLREIK
jgi:hypothetical protein